MNFSRKSGTKDPVVLVTSKRSYLFSGTISTDVSDVDDLIFARNDARLEPTGAGGAYVSPQVVGDVITVAGSVYSQARDGSGLTVIPTSGGSSSVINQVAGGNLGSTFNQSVLANATTWVTGVLTQNLTVTPVLAQGATLRLILAQDSTGSWTLNISDGTNTQSVQVPSAPNTNFALDVYSPNGTDLVISPEFTL